MKNIKKLKIKRKEWNFYKQMRPLMDGGLAFTIFSSIPNIEFEFLINEHDTNIMDGVHLKGISYILDSKIINKILKVCDDYDVCFTFDLIKGQKYIQEHWSFTFIVNDKKNKNRGIKI